MLMRAKHWSAPHRPRARVFVAAAVVLAWFATFTAKLLLPFGASIASLTSRAISFLDVDHGSPKVRDSQPAKCDRRVRQRTG
jgi:hypothetical protein